MTDPTLRCPSTLRYVSVLYLFMACEILTLPRQIDGEVYDVSANKRVYGPGGGYSHL
jgi:hypothetical protein